MRVRTCGHVIDLDRFEISGAAGPVAVEPQVFAVIATLLHNRGRVVTKEELLDEVWSSRFVSESALTSRVKAARRALGDDGATQAVIATVRYHGYKWVAEVEPVETVETLPPDPEIVSGAPPDLLDPIVGRDRELSEVLELMDRARVVTLVGVGGTGKTRLACEVLRHRRGCLVELAPVRDTDAIAGALAAAIDVQLGQRSDMLSACIEYLTGKPGLLVVDNCEHVLAAVPAVLRRLLAGCPELSVLCTSREPLGLPDEHIVNLGPLAVPTDTLAPEEIAASPAVELFVNRARRAQNSFPFDTAALVKAGSLCRALDGLPLAIELAAGRSAALGLDDVHARLDRRLDLLSDDRPTALDRHRSLRATLAWSYELLDSESKRLFRHLSVFPGGFSLSTAEQLATALGVPSDPATVVARLVQTSMLTRTSTPFGARFSQLETVRAFGVDELAQRGELDGAHELLVAWALELADTVYHAIHTSDEPAWDDRVRREMPNLRAAHRHLADAGRHREVATMLLGLDGWARWRDVSEIWDWEAELLDAVDPDDAELRQTALALVVVSSFMRGRRDLSARYVEELLAFNPSGWPLLQGLQMAANVSLFAGRPHEARDYWLRRRELAECPELRPESTAWAANAAGYAGAFEQGRALATEARAEADASGSPTERARAAYVTGELEYCAGSGDEQRWLEEAIGLAETSGAHFIAGVASVTLATSRAAVGDRVGAARIYHELIGRWLRTGTWTQQWTTLRNAADLLIGIDDALVVQVWAAAHADPAAAVLDDAATERETALRATLLDRLGESVVAEFENAGRVADRAQLANAAAEQLCQLIDAQ